MLLSNLRFGAFLSYVPKKEEHKALVQALKQDKVFSDSGITICERIAKEVKEKLVINPEFSEFFGDNVFLVPAPKSSLTKPGTLCVPKRLAEEFSKIRIGTILDCLERITEVTKSSLSNPKDRPKPIDHYNSIIVKRVNQNPMKILLIDNIITRGATILGCASKLRESFPNASIKAFVVLQAISNSKNFKSIEDPYTGDIILLEDGNCTTQR